MVLLAARIKEDIKRAMMDILYEPYEHRRLKVLQSLITRNRILVRSEYECFTFKGEFYGQHYPGAYQRPKLQSEFHEEMKQWLQEVVDLRNRELPIVEGFLVRVLNSSDSGADWIAMLPDFLHPAIKHHAFSTLLLPRQHGDSECAAFCALFDDEIQLLKQRMAINLIHI